VPWILSGPQLIGLISGVITGVTAGAVGFIGAAALIAGLRFAAFLLAGLFFFDALRAAFLLPAFFLLDFFFATRFFDERFLDDFFFAFFADFFFAFFFAAMVAPFNVDRLSCAAGPTGLLRTTNVRIRTLVSRFYAWPRLSRVTI
jgi:hypothetical protein